MELSGYIPMDRRWAMSKGQDLPDRSSGAALFADLSGFTPLTELLVKELGPGRGAEELTRQLNTVYDALVAEVHHYEGSVIGFSGDAITCWFDTDHGLRAVACALNMQEKMGRFAKLSTPNGTPAPLTLKVALVTGPVRRFLVGDPQIQVIDVLAGMTMDHLSKVGEQIKDKEIIVESEAASRLESKVTIQEWRENAETNERLAVVAGLACQVRTDPWPATPVLTEEQVRPWLLRPVYQRLRSGRGQFLAELRPVVALFLKFSGLNYDQDDAAGEKLDMYIRWVQQVLACYEGFLVQLTTGDKGSYLYAAFGAPVAHDDDAVRAVAAAVELRSPLPELDFTTDVQIGISQGRMWTGAYGSSARCTYGVLGDEVNVAARLMGKAVPGQVLVSGRVANAAAKSYEFEALGSVELKGKQAPVPIFLALGTRPPSKRRPIAFFKSPLVGREDELAQMEQTLTSTLAGNGQVLCLMGVSGIGKSHLAAEFIERALSHNFRVATGACQSTNQAISYTPWRQAFRDLFDLADEPTKEDQTSSITRQTAQLEETIRHMNPGWFLRLPLLGDLLGLPIPDNETTAALEPPMRQESLQILAVEIIQAWARKQPLLLLIEDAHWMDEASLGLTLELSRAIGSVPILLIMVHRPFVEKRIPPLDTLDQLSYYNSLDLPELMPQEVERMVGDRLGGQPSKLLLSLIQILAQGNPFFVEELIDALRETKQLYLQDGVWAIAEGLFDTLHKANCLAKQNGEWVLTEDAHVTAADLGVPDTINAVVLSRVDRLPETHKTTLKVASTIGRVFEFDLLSRSHPVHPGHEELVEQMAALERRDFTRLETEYPRPIYVFKHNITQEVTYQSLLEDQRQQLHRTVGEALESLQPGAVERLAYHYSHSDSRDKALFFLDKAACKAQREYANETALNYYDRALALDERWNWLKGKVEVLHVLGRRDEEKTMLGELLARPDAPAPDVAYLWGQHHEAVAEFPQAVAALRKALEAYKGQVNTVGQSRCLALLGLVARRRGDYCEAQDWYEKALEQLDQKACNERIQILNGLGTVLRQQGQFDIAEDHYKQALALSRESGNLIGEAQAIDNLGTVAYRQRNPAKAMTHHKQAAEMRRSIGDRVGEGVSLNNLALAAIGVGDYDRALESLLATLAIQRTIEDRWGIVNTLMSIGGLYFMLGDLSNAEINLEQGLSLTREIGDPAGEMYILGNLGLVMRERGDLATAEALLTECLKPAQAQNERETESMCLSHLARTALQAGQMEQAINHAKEALGIRNDIGLQVLTTADFATLAVAHQETGNQTAAVDYARSAFDILEDCGGEGPEFPHHDYYLCYLVFSAAGEEETARAALESAHRLVLAQADTITDQAIRRSFLEQVRFNREIVQAYEAAAA